MRFFVLILIVIPLNSVCQELILEKKSLTDVTQLEEIQNSENIGFHFFQIHDEYIDKNYIKLEPKCLRFKDVNDNFSPNLHTWYYFDSDSIVKAINYYWGFYNSGFNANENKELIKNELNNTEKWANHYNSLKKKIKSQVGSRGKEIKNKKFEAYTYKESIWLEDDYKIKLISKIVSSDNWIFDTYVSIQIIFK